MSEKFLDSPFCSCRMFYGFHWDKKYVFVGTKNVIIRGICGMNMTS